MSTTTINITYGSDTVRLRCNLVEASAPLIVDGETTQYQTADARHRTDHAVLLAAMFAWPEATWPKRPSYGSDAVEANDAWDELAYEAADERMTMAEAREWAQAAEAGEYLVEYEDTGMTADEDTGSRCGFDDQELDELKRILRGRDLKLTADDRGLVAESVD